MTTHRPTALKLTAALISIWIASWIQVQAREPESGNQQRRFSSPEEAIKAVVTATQAKDKTALHEIFGPSVDQMLTGDEALDAANFNAFTHSVAEHCAPVHEGEAKLTLEIGADNWPFPIPLIHQSGGWFFDTGAGKEEIICRHIGRDELHAIGFCRAYVQAQRQFADRHGDRGEVKAYALNFTSLPTALDSLPASASPAARSQTVADLLSEEDAQTTPNSVDPQRTFYGYRFKILTRQGRGAPGGKLDYLVQGKLVRGFALVAYPSQWGKSGMMTFIINQDGKLYQRNLGEKTASIASALVEYNPTREWRRIEEPGVDDW